MAFFIISSQEKMAAEIAISSAISAFTFFFAKIIIAIRANRFVRGMVRAIVGGLVEVGKLKMSEDRFFQLLHNPTEEDRAKYLAPAEGLVFWKVRYPKEFGLWE